LNFFLNTPDFWECNKNLKESQNGRWETIYKKWNISILGRGGVAERRPLHVVEGRRGGRLLRRRSVRRRRRRTVLVVVVMVVVQLSGRGDRRPLMKTGQLAAGIRLEDLAEAVGGRDDGGGGRRRRGRALGGRRALGRVPRALMEIVRLHGVGAERELLHGLQRLVLVGGRRVGRRRVNGAGGVGGGRRMLGPRGHQTVHGKRGRRLVLLIVEVLQFDLLLVLLVRLVVLVGGGGQTRRPAVGLLHARLLFQLLLLLLLPDARTHHFVQQLAALHADFVCGFQHVQGLLLPLDGVLLLLEGILLLEAPPTPQVAAVVEHVVRIGVQSPVAALAGLLVVPRHFHEALVQTEIVANRILPALLVLPVVGKAVHDELINTVEGDLFVGRVLDGHGDEGDVRVRRFHHVLVGGVVAAVGGEPGGRHGGRRRVRRGVRRVPGCGHRRRVLLVRVAGGVVRVGHGVRATLSVVGSLVAEQGVHHKDTRAHRLSK